MQKPRLVQVAKAFRAAEDHISSLMVLHSQAAFAAKVGMSLGKFVCKGGKGEKPSLNHAT